jgi:hypothetical protein
VVVEVPAAGVGAGVPVPPMLVCAITAGGRLACAVSGAAARTAKAATKASRRTRLLPMRHLLIQRA